MNKLDKTLEKALKACQKPFPPNTSLMEKMKLWTHYNNLLLLKANNLLKKDKDVQSKTM